MIRIDTVTIFLIYLLIFNKMKKLLIFDMDGTLVDSSDSITNTINHVRSHHNLEPLEKSPLVIFSTPSFSSVC
jgi:trehalose-6-phosphatase